MPSQLRKDIAPTKNGTMVAVPPTTVRALGPKTTIRLAAYDLMPWIERAAALALIVALSPLLLLCTLIVRFDTSGPALFRQKRVGRFGRPFFILKFRTMIVNAEATTGPVLARTNDPRITPVGRLLRASHLDELPQLFNVLRGEMSFIGPRPERPEFVREFRFAVPGYDKRHVVSPGITGLAQILLPYDARPEEKIRWDLHAIENRASGALAAWIIWRTARKAIAPFLGTLPQALPAPGFLPSQSGNIAAP